MPTWLRTIAPTATRIMPQKGDSGKPTADQERRLPTGERERDVARVE